MPHVWVTAIAVIVCVFTNTQTEYILWSLKSTTAGLLVLPTILKIWSRDFKRVPQSDAEFFLFVCLLFNTWRSGCTWNCLICNVTDRCFGIHSAKLGKRQLGKLDNWLRFLMLIGRKVIKVINIHVFWVALLPMCTPLWLTSKKELRIVYATILGVKMLSSLHKQGFCWLLGSLDTPFNSKTCLFSQDIHYFLTGSTSNETSTQSSHAECFIETELWTNNQSHKIS